MQQIHIRCCRGKQCQRFYFSTFPVTVDILLPAVPAELESCLLDMIQGKVEEQAPCCARWEVDMDWGRTSQVPELGFLCQPAIPAAHPGACWQGKFPKLSTSDVTLILQQWARKRRSVITFALPHVSYFCQTWASPKDGSILDSHYPRGSSSSVKGCQGRLKWWRGCHDNSSATLPLESKTAPTPFLVATGVFSRLGLWHRLSH